MIRRLIVLIVMVAPGFLRARPRPPTPSGVPIRKPKQLEYTPCRRQYPCPS
jgi:hypothetical protein